MLRREAPPLALLLAFAALFYRQLALQGRILVDYDVLTYFYPNFSYAAASLRAGHLPLWDPYLFTGVPFLANMQTALFYPPNWAFIFLPVPQGYSLSVVGHIFLLATGAYAFARLALGVGRLGALAAALVLGFGGFASSLVTHLNQLQAAAWLPWLFLLLVLALRTRRPILFLGWAAALALQILAGHIQIAYISTTGLMLYLAYWVLGGEADENGAVGWRRRLLTGATCGACLLLAFGLAAAQLVPAAELSALSVRAGGMTFKEATAFSLPPWVLLKALLPLYGTEGLPTTEWLAYSAVLGMALASAGIAWGWRRGRFFIGLGIIALLLALGLFGPFYPLLYGYLPGLNLFRVPARWLLLYAFSLSAVVALGVESVAGAAEAGIRWADFRKRRNLFNLLLHRFVTLAGVFVVAAVPLLIYRLAVEPAYQLQRPVRQVLLAWAALLLLGLLLIILRRRWAATAVVVLLAGELLFASQGLMLNEGNLPEAFDSLRPSIAQLRADPGLYRVLPFTDNVFDPGDMPEMRTMLAGVLSPKGIYDYIVAAKHKETLTPNLPLAYRIPSLDGYDGGMLPLRDYVEFKDVLPLSRNRAPDGRLREQLESIPDRYLLGSLNVKYVLMDRTRDRWLEGVYYDLAITATLGPGESLELPASSNYRVTAMGLVSYLSDAAALPDGSSVATITAVDDSGQAHPVELQAGVHTAEGRYVSGAVQHRQAKVAGPWMDDPQAWDYYARVGLGSPLYLKKVVVRYTAKDGRLILRGLSAVDERTAASYPITLSPDLRLVHLGDVKIFENLANLPRAYLLHRARAVADEGSALAALQDPGFPWGQEGIVEAPDAPALAEPPEGAAERVDIVRYGPEEVALQAKVASPALLVLSDSYYPGWRAWVDGQEAPILRVNHIQRGIAVPAGEHQVVFRYQPRSLYAGFALSGLSLILLFGGVLLSLRRRPAR
ncbi:MAG: YfhO family protein [Chloroflexi bacterium]|nr:YfhO family protein [Chloroflexota bacterium]